MNDKILIDRAMLQSVLDRWDRNIYAQVHGAMEDLRSALASSTAMPDDKDKRIAELEADYKALSHKMIAETAHVAELSAELMAFKQQKPVAWMNEHGRPYKTRMFAEMNSDNKRVTPLVPAARAQENSK